MKNKISQKGFTVLELVIAMGIFITLMGIISGIFVGAIRSQRTLVELINANDTASLALEQMTREIRTGKDFCITEANQTTCSGTLTAGDSLLFTNANGSTVIYRFQNDAIQRSDDGGANFIAITGNRVVVSDLQFSLIHALLGSTPAWPPRITIVMTIGSLSSNLQNIFTHIQTTVSGRNI